MRKRRKFAPEFKAKVALEALAGELTMFEIAAKHDVHPNLVQQWKRQAKENLPDVFSGKAGAQQQSREAEIKALHAKIGGSASFDSASSCRSVARLTTSRARAKRR